MESLFDLMTSATVFNADKHISNISLPSSFLETPVTDSVRQLDEMRALTVLLVQKIFMPLVVLVGCVGNAINMTVLTRPTMRSSTNCYLTALALYDMLYLVFAFSMSLKHYKQVVKRFSKHHTQVRRYV